MSAQVLFRTDPKLKSKFKEKVQSHGLSMDYVLNVFIKTYVDSPQIIETHVNEEVFDEMIRTSFNSSEAKNAMQSLHATLKKKGLS